MIVDNSPHIKDKDSVMSIMWWVVIALLPAAGAGVYYFGISALWIILVSVLSAVITETVIQKFMGRNNTVKDGSAVITGLLLALVLPPTVPLWLAAVGSIIAIAIAKFAFGGLGFNIFNPALIGRAFLVGSWPILMTTWLSPDGLTSATPLGALKVGGELIATNMQMFLGNIGGTIGETSVVAILVGALILFLKKIINWRIPATYIGTVFVFAWIFGQDAIFHILGGGLMLGAFFMATDYVTSPITRNGKFVFGVGCGLLTIIIRVFGGINEGVMYSILLMNAFTPIIDRYTQPKVFGAKK